MTALGLLVVLLCAEPVDDLLFRARYAQQVAGDFEEAIRLYSEALRDKSLGPGRQARIRLRIALCYERQGEIALALDPYLVESIYTHKDVEPEVRRRAADARARLRRQLPAAVEVKPESAAERKAARRKRAAERLAEAHRFLEGGDEIRAFIAVQTALELDPDSEEATALLAELETRMSGVADFLDDPLRWVRTWTEARITDVAARAAALLRQGIEFDEKDQFGLAKARFRAAIEVLDACEFTPISDRLGELRTSVAEHWRAMRARRLGPRQADPEIPAPPRRSSLSSDYLNVLERMLALVSSSEREYRIVPVNAARAPAGSDWQESPARYRLFRGLPSRWSPARFARHYLRSRVAPRSWRERGNYLEDAGGILVARNRPDILDALLKEVTRMERPAEATLRGRFLLVPVSDAAFERFEARFGAFRREGRAAAPALVQILPNSLDYICSALRDYGAEVDLDKDTFRARITNGAPQTLFAAAPLSRAPGYAGFRQVPGDTLASHYGVLIDVYPLQDRRGRTTLALRVISRAAERPLGGAPRFVTQETECFLDVQPGQIVVVGGLRDPFSTGEDSSLLLLWESADSGETAPEPEAGPVGAEVPLRRLLIEMADDPGPRLDAERGFVKRDAIGVLRDRAAFLETFVRAKLGDDGVAVDVEEAVLTVPSARREGAADLVAQLERESNRSYVVRIQSRAARTAVVQRWMNREGLKPRQFDTGYVALAPVRQLVIGTELPDAFAPATWAKLTCRGFQARHGRSVRTRTSPAYSSESELATAETRTVAEGIRVTVRPYAWNGRLWADVVVQTGAIESEVEEMALTMAVPSHRTRVGGTRVAGTIDFGDWKRPQTAILTGIAHPTATRPDKLTEIVISLSVRAVP